MRYEDYVKWSGFVIWLGVGLSIFFFLGSFTLHSSCIRGAFYWVLTCGSGRLQGYYRAARSIFFAGLERLSDFLDATTLEERGAWFFFLIFCALVLFWLITKGIAQVTISASLGILKIDVSKAKAKNSVSFSEVIRHFFPDNSRKYKWIYRLSYSAHILPLVVSARCVWIHKIHFPCLVFAAVGFFVVYFLFEVILCWLGWSYELEMAKRKDAAKKKKEQTIRQNKEAEPKKELEKKLTFKQKASEIIRIIGWGHQ